MIIEFNRLKTNEAPKDNWEQAGDRLLKPWRLAFGQSVWVDQSLKPQTHCIRSKISRIAAAIPTLLLFPVTLPLAGIGLFALARSQSYQKVSAAYCHAKKLSPPAQPGPSPRSLPEGFATPLRRQPPLGRDTVKWVGGKAVPLNQTPRFIPDAQILKIHPMKYLSSPFKPNPKDRLEDLEKKALGLAVTEDGKTVILQQGMRACVPAVVAMLVRDHGKEPNYQAVENVNLASKEQLMRWIREAHLAPKETQLSHLNMEEKIALLEKLLKSHGSGILDMEHRSCKAHVVILDAISLKEGTATVRDPYHGWMVTVTLDTLRSWHIDSIIQIDS